MSIFNRTNGTNVPVKRIGHPLASFQNEFNNLFENFFTGTHWPEVSMMPTLDLEMDFHPRIDVKDNDKEYLIEAELPGMDEKDVELSLENNCLTMKGEKKEERKEEKENYYHMERKYGSFYRTIPFPSEINEEKVNANFKDGILKVIIAKSDKAVKSRKTIDIKHS